MFLFSTESIQCNSETCGRFHDQNIPVCAPMWKNGLNSLPFPRVKGFLVAETVLNNILSLDADRYFVEEIGRLVLGLHDECHTFPEKSTCSTSYRKNLKPEFIPTVLDVFESLFDLINSFGTRYVATHNAHNLDMSLFSGRTPCPPSGVDSSIVKNVIVCPCE